MGGTPPSPPRKLTVSSLRAPCKASRAHVGCDHRAEVPIATPLRVGDHTDTRAKKQMFRVLYEFRSGSWRRDTENLRFGVLKDLTCKAAGALLAHSRRKERQKGERGFLRHLAGPV